MYTKSIKITSTINIYKYDRIKANDMIFLGEPNSGVSINIFCSNMLLIPVSKLFYTVSLNMFVISRIFSASQEKKAANVTTAFCCHITDLLAVQKRDRSVPLTKNFTQRESCHCLKLKSKCCYVGLHTKRRENMTVCICFFSNLKSAFVCKE